VSNQTSFPRKIYYFGLAVIAIGLPVSVFLMSLGQFIILAGLLLDGRLVEKLKRFRSNKMAVLVSSVMLLHFLGLLYSTDFNYGFNDIRVKAPLLLLPLFIAGAEPLSKKTINWLLAGFVASVTVGTVICMGVYYGIVPTKKPVNDIRDISIFISHIRFSLMIALSVFITAWYLYHESSFALKTGYLILIAWLIIFLTVLNAITGIVALVVVVFALLLFGLFTLKNRIVKTSALIAVLLLIAGLGFYLKTLTDLTRVIHPVDLSKLEKKTALGNDYVHYPDRFESENGYLTWIYYSPAELEKVWSKNSNMRFLGLSKKGDTVAYTLVRYLASKGLRKDAAAAATLSPEEFRLIENGETNVNDIGRSELSKRVLQILWEFRNYQAGGNSNGHSAIMRLEFWKAALSIIKKHPIIGVGTGDVKIAFMDQYEEMHSTLDPGHRLRAHNQFLAITVAFGVLGLAWFLLAMIYPMIREGLTFNYFYAVFFIIVFISMLNEDTLETQAGVTFYAFFNSLFLFACKRTADTN